MVMETMQESPLRNDLSLEMTRIFNDNDTEDISPFTIWEMYKCVMRGLLIKKATELWKNRQAVFNSTNVLLAKNHEIY